MENQTQQQEQPQPPPQVINVIQQEAPKKNGLGTAGFVLAIIALFLGWIPFLGWVMWFLGLLFSFIGVFKAPRGLAIAGLIISLIGIILLIVVFAAMGAGLSFL